MVASTEQSVTGGAVLPSPTPPSSTNGQPKVDVPFAVEGIQGLVIQILNSPC